MGRTRLLRNLVIYLMATVLIISSFPVRPLYADSGTVLDAIPAEPAAPPVPPDAVDESSAVQAGELPDGNEGAAVQDESVSDDPVALETPDTDGDFEAPPAETAHDGPASAQDGEQGAAYGAGEASSRAPIAFDANQFVKRLKFTLESGGVSHQYDLTSGEDVDTTADFPEGLARSATYVGDMSLDIRSMAEAQGAYPLVPGDSISCTFPSILRPNGTLSGRLRDSSADWDGRNGGVGDYRIADGKLVITYDTGYIQEKSGKIIESAIKFSGGFDTSTQTDRQFDFNLVFGNVMIGTRFSRLEIVRNLSIEKTGATSGGYARVDANGRLTYTVDVKAGQDNTHTLKNVQVTDTFTDGSEDKVDLASMQLVSAKVDGEDITQRLSPMTDDQGRVIGWNIGNLPAGQVAHIVYTVAVDKEGITDAVADAKEEDATTDAIGARTIRNTATASAEGVPAVTDDFSMPVQNSVYISKSNGRYDREHQAQHFTITITASSYNCYTEHYMPIYDTLSSAPAAAMFARSGVDSASVRRADGTTFEVPLAGVSYPSSREWRAALPSVEPGDVITIDAFTQVSDAYWGQTGSGTVGDGDIWNYAYIGSGVNAGDFYANDLVARSDYCRFGLTKRYLSKNSPSIKEDGTVTWIITGNEQGKSASPANIAGKTITDTLGPDQVFPAGTAIVTFYNQDGSRAGTDSIALKEGSTTFSYTIPEAYGTCGFTITYTSRITDWDTYVGPAKSYTNRVEGLWDISTGGSTSDRPRVPRLTKRFVAQADDWSQWKTSIFNELEAGDVYTDTVRNGVGYMYFTNAELAAVSLTIGGVNVDPSLYRVEPAGQAQDGRYPSFTITFTGKVFVEKGGATVMPSSKNPLVITYTAKMVDPAFGTGVRDYYNDARLAVGDVEETDYDYCRRNNAREITKEVYSSSKGMISWKMRANYFGYSGQPDGTCIVTDVLPAGTEFVGAYKLQGSGSIQVLSVEENEDGTTTVVIKLSGLSHYEVSRDHPTDNNAGVEFHFVIKSRITDEDYLYGSESRDFSFTNTVSLNDRYGHEKTASATATIHHSAIKKTMTYNESTAPYAQFSVEVNQEKVDLNPDGDRVAIVDVSSESLALDPASISVINATTGDPVAFEVDASGMAENRVTIRVPDETYVKIVYNAQVLGMTGHMVAVGNTAYFEGHQPGPVNEGSISKTVSVLKATGQAVSEPMVWLSKRDERAAPLAGATYELSVYDASHGWNVVNDGIETNGGTGSKGVKVESLELGRLYRLVEISAPEGYVLDSTPRYFVLYGEDTVAPVLPEGLDPDKVFEGPSGSVITAYNKPFTTVEFDKVDDEGTRLSGARLQVIDEGGDVARDGEGRMVEFTTSARARQRYVLAPGEYRLHELSAPDGYELAADVRFTVTGDRDRTVLQDGAAVSVVTMTDASATTSLTVRKRWLDAGDVDGARPDTVRMQLVADGEPVDGAVIEITAAGPDGAPGTEDDWTAAFERLAVMRGGLPVSYSVEEVDVPTGYHASYSWDGAVAVVTNSRDFEPLDVKIAKHWDDGGDARDIRPNRITVRIVADGGSVVRTVDILAVGPDGAAGTPDDWTASVSGLPAVDGDHVIAYTIEEELPAGYRLSEEPRRTDEGFALTNELVPEEAPRTSGKHVDSNGSSMPSTGDALLAGAWALVLAGAMLVLLGSLARRENRG